jgi:hypothetical protein
VRPHLAENSKSVPYSQTKRYSWHGRNALMVRHCVTCRTMIDRQFIKQHDTHCSPQHNQAKSKPGLGISNVYKGGVIRVARKHWAEPGGVRP